jgi:hypothetical protein
MSETQTHPVEDFPLTPKNDFDVIESIQSSQEEVEAARRLVEKEEATEPEVVNTTDTPNHNRLHATVATASAGLVLAATGAGLVTVNNATTTPPVFSEETNTYTVMPNDGLEKIVDKIPGINTIDKDEAERYVSVDPANIDVLKDGLQPGDQIEIPISINGAESEDQ